MEEKVRKIRKKRVFTVEKGRQQFRFCRTNVISEKNTEKGETYPIYLGSDGMCTAVATILCGGHKNKYPMHGISGHYFASLVVRSVFCVPSLR